MRDICRSTWERKHTVLVRRTDIRHRRNNWEVEMNLKWMSHWLLGLKWENESEVNARCR